MSMRSQGADSALTPERIIESAEDVLRHYGPSKATVVDVARALGVSHGSVYKHFASKAELRDAVMRRWLARLDEPLEQVIAAEGSASFRLRSWLNALIAIKRQRAAQDPELFATYRELADDAREVVQTHVANLTEQIESIIKQGVKSGEFSLLDTSGASKAVLSATTRFHNPRHASEWSNPDINKEFEAVYSLILAGLRTGPTA